VAARQGRDPQSRPGVRPKKKARARLLRLAEHHPEWALGFEDETWWSRVAQPHLHAWAPAQQPLRLVEQSIPATAPEPKALACYGLLARSATPHGAPHEEVWLRFVDGRPVSAMTTAFLAWRCAKLAHQGKTALLLVRDNASWHRSAAVRSWIREHNRQVKRWGTGVRLIVCPLPTKSPWLNPLEPRWVHGKRGVVEADGVLSAWELADRACAYFQCPHETHLVISEQVA
jgi:DDE superfamily endonuclease